MCGVIGIIDQEEDVFDLTAIGLMSLQHRGQDACGILTNEGEQLHVKKELGAVHDVFSTKDGKTLKGTAGIGHTRYATQGQPRVEDAQPLTTKKVALAQNGNMINYFSLKQKMEKKGVTLITSVDTELMLHVFAQAFDEKKEFFEAAQEVLDNIRGGYAIVGIIAGKGLFAIRDPRGIRPLVLGKNGHSYVLASESVALQATGAEFVRDLEPGEAVLITPDMKIQQRVLKREDPAHCMFEWIYFASPNSLMEGRSVYKARLALGQQTGKHIQTEDVDVVLPVPDSGRTAAIKLAESLNIRYREGLIRDRYRGARTFIMASQKARERAVNVKLKPIISTIQGKSVAVVDDSIVRGTTSRKIVDSLHQHGAEEVTFVSTCPPIRHPCFYGVDFSNPKELIAHERTIEEIREHMDAEHLVYNTVEDLKRAVKRPLCVACLTNEYPEPVTEEEKKMIQEQRLGVQNDLDGFNVLIIGGGGREHALALKVAESPKLNKLYAIPGNPGIAQLGTCSTLDIMDNDTVVNFAKDKKIDMAIVGPEAPLVNGLADALEEAGIPSFGPKQSGARFEGSKAFSRQFMKKYGLPSVKFEEFSDYEKAAAYIKEQGAPIVVKADGLAAGKGVLVAETVDEALVFAKECLEGGKFKEAGASIVVEECLVGEEGSYMVFTDGKSFKPMVYSQDHKQVYEGDKGPNTGGMGAYSPAPILEGHEDELEELMEKFLKGIEAEGIDYKGVLYVGLMKTKDGLKILEFNVRFGDPEAQVLLPRMQNDLLDVIDAVNNEQLAQVELKPRDEHCMCIVLASGGYPGSYGKGKEIQGLDNVDGVHVIHAGTKENGGAIVTNGGRVLNVVAMGSTLQEAADKAYAEAAKISFDQMYLRKDIGWKELERNA